MLANRRPARCARRERPLQARGRGHDADPTAGELDAPAQIDSSAIAFERGVAASDSGEQVGAYQHGARRCHEQIPRLVVLGLVQLAFRRCRRSHGQAIRGAAEVT